jgi:SAM-dependent methyltransferase
MPYRTEVLRRTEVSSYVGLDVQDALVYDAAIRPDAVWDGVTIPFPDRSFDSALATEVFEHVPDIDLLLGEIRRVLRPGGILFFTTPFVWPYHEMPHDCQRWTAPGLKRRLEVAGFREVAITCEGNWHSALAQMVGLWAARAPMPSVMRRLTRYPAFAIQKILMRFEGDSQPAENSMPRGISGTARV